MRRRPYRSQRRGTVLAMTAALMVGAFAILALAVDLGYIQVVTTELQRSADSAALAGAWSLLENSGQGGGDSNVAVSQAAVVAGQYVAANRVGAGTMALSGSDISIGCLSNPSNTSQSIDTLADPRLFNAIRVRVRRAADQNGEIPLFFAQVLGMNGIAKQSEATAVFLTNLKGFKAPAAGAENLQILPFALDQETWNSLLAGHASDNWTWDEANAMVIPGRDNVLEVNLFPQGTGSPGNRGTVNICTGNGNSTARIKRQIVDGITAEDLSSFGGSLQLGDDGTLELNGDTGISAGVEASLLSIKGQKRIIPIFSTVSGPGNNATYTIVAFAGIRIIDVNLNGSMSSKRVIVQPAAMTTNGAIQGGGTQTSHYVFSPVWLLR